jgi:PBSX family phage terminase large subunit
MLSPLKGKALKSFQDADAWLNIWEGSVSSGKTVTTLFNWMDFIVNGPPGELVMVGKTERTLKRNIIDPMVQMYGSRNINTIGMGKGEIHLFGRRVYLIGANDERAEQKIRGLSLVGAYCDEITIFPESFWQMLLSRLRQPGARLFGTTNPDSPYHWLKEGYLDKPGLLDLKSFKFTIDDNPNLDPQYVKRIKETYSGLWYKRFILGEWCLAEGAIYDMWDPIKHVVEESPFDESQPIDRYIGIDYGTVNAAAFLFIGIQNHCAYCEREYYYESSKHNRQKDEGEYGRDLNEFVGKTTIRSIIIDPSAVSFKGHLRNKYGLPVRDADNSVLDGIRTTGRLLASEKLYVHSSCKNLIKEFSSYVWDANSQVSGVDRPMKQNDHACDALRYVLHTVLGKGEARVIRI